VSAVRHILRWPFNCDIVPPTITAAMPALITLRYILTGRLHCARVLIFTLIQWNSLGYPAVYPFESTTEYENHNMHTAEDIADSSEFSFAHAHEFTKLVVAFTKELAL
jgi:hypothetical protein